MANRLTEFLPLEGLRGLRRPASPAQPGRNRPPPARDEQAGNWTDVRLGKPFSFALKLGMWGILTYSLAGLTALAGPIAKGGWEAVGVLLMGLGIVARTAAPGMLVGAAAMIVGGFFGFLFGIPRTQQPDLPEEDERATSGRGDNSTRYLHNTNLEQISDWLTKILVGVGLVQLGEISVRLESTVRAVGLGLGGNPETSQVFAAGVLVYFTVCGFIFGFLWTRLYLHRAYVEFDLALLRQTLSRTQRAAKTAQENAKQVREEMETTQALLVGIGRPEAAAGEPAGAVPLRDRATGPFPDDPWRGVFGGSPEQNGRKLHAEVAPIAGSENLFAITLRVESTDPARPLVGPVRFFLHHTFQNQCPLIPPSASGAAELHLRSYGAFTVGALTDGGATELEMNLAELPEAPQRFRER